MQKSSRVDICYPFDGCLYFKIYCSESIVDEMVLKPISIFLNSSVKREVIDSWFFIRYWDPEHHLRIRFFFDPDKFIFEDYFEFLSILEKLHTNWTVSNFSIENYHPEINRYAPFPRADFEKIFYSNSIFISELYVSFINIFEIEKNRIFLACLLVNNYLKSFLDDDGLKNSVLKFRNSFFSEFAVSKSSKVNLDSLYRANSSDFVNLMQESNFGQYSYFGPASVFLSESLHEDFKLISDFFIKFGFSESCVFGICHMACNRIFVSRNREYELIVYDFLNRYHSSKKYFK